MVEVRGGVGGGVGCRGFREELPTNHEYGAGEGSTGVVDDPDTPVGVSRWCRQHDKGGGGERRPLTSRPTAEYDKLSLINDEKQTYVQAGGDAWSTRPPLTLPAQRGRGRRDADTTFKLSHEINRLNQHTQETQVPRKHSKFHRRIVVSLLAGMGGIYLPSALKGLLRYPPDDRHRSKEIARTVLRFQNDPAARTTAHSLP